MYSGIENEEYVLELQNQAFSHFQLNITNPFCLDNRATHAFNGLWVSNGMEGQKVFPGAKDVDSCTGVG